MKRKLFAITLEVNQSLENFFTFFVLMVIIISLVIGTDTKSQNTKEYVFIKTSSHIGLMVPHYTKCSLNNLWVKECGEINYPYGAQVQFDCHLNDSVHQARPPTINTFYKIL